MIESGSRWGPSVSPVVLGRVSKLLTDDVACALPSFACQRAVSRHLDQVSAPGSARRNAIARAVPLGDCGAPSTDSIQSHPSVSVLSSFSVLGIRSKARRISCRRFFSDLFETVPSTSCARKSRVHGQASRSKYIR